MMMAGLYLPDPYHPPMDRVQIATFWGQRWRDVITEPVPRTTLIYRNIPKDIGAELTTHRNP